MSIRSILYGYCYIQAKKEIDTDEGPVVLAINAWYRMGDSLGTIANRLTEANIPYSPGNCVWHKARIKRILQDSRYLGLDGYPPLLTQEQYDDANRRLGAAGSKSNVMDEDIMFLKPYCVCGDCYSPCPGAVTPFKLFGVVKAVVLL